MTSAYELNIIIANFLCCSLTSLLTKKPQLLIWIHKDLIVSEQQVKTGWCEDHQCWSSWVTSTGSSLLPETRPVNKHLTNSTRPQPNNNYPPTGSFMFLIWRYICKVILIYKARLFVCLSPFDPKKCYFCSILLIILCYLNARFDSAHRAPEKLVIIIIIA